MIEKQTYEFKYFFNEFGEEKSAFLEADNDREAVLKFYDIYGIAEFVVLKDGIMCFTDDKFPKEKELMISQQSLDYM